MNAIINYINIIIDENNIFNNGREGMAVLSNVDGSFEDCLAAMESIFNEIEVIREGDSFSISARFF